MGNYINWQDVTDRYPATASKGSAADINPTYIIYAENEIEAALSRVFDIPFAQTNVTAKDCMIEASYLRIGALTVKESEKLRNMLNMKLDNLISGKTSMVLSTGEIVTSKGSPIYSSDAGYHPTFGVGDIIDMEVDHDKIDAEHDERYTR